MKRYARAGCCPRFIEAASAGGNPGLYRHLYGPRRVGASDHVLPAFVFEEDMSGWGVEVSVVDSWSTDLS